MYYYLFLRYANTPNPEVSAKLAEYIDPAYNAILNPIPGIVITHFASSKRIDEIKQGMESVPGIKFDLIETPDAPVSPKRRATGLDLDPRTRSQQQVPRSNEPVTKADLERKLQKALTDENFEAAAELRDRIAREFPETNESFITSINEFKKNLKK